MSETSSAHLQNGRERAPPAKQYDIDAFPGYDALDDGAPSELQTDQKETYSGEAVQADLRHDLKRLARQSRCFSRRLDALHKNLRLFVYGYNRRQITKPRDPNSSFHLVDFICPLS